MGEISMHIPRAEFQEDANNSLCCSIDKFKPAIFQAFKAGKRVKVKVLLDIII
jgi:hypothetical protein